jgi:uncharacterized protein (TIGR03085 family)
VTALDAREREQLCDLFVELGPDAPTLCEGWTTADLAAHLVVRERKPQAGPGLLIGGRWAELTERLRRRELERGYPAVVERVRSGPPPFPWRVPGLRDLLNLQEYFVHHEDVRRANGRSRRTDVGDVEDAMWKNLTRAAGFQLRKVDGVRVVLARPGGPEVVARKGEPRARLTGEPGELVLYLTGRRSAADVTVDGDPAAVAAVERASLGI